jgi:hypothetical protein
MRVGSGVLVTQQQVWTSHHPPCNGNALLLPAEYLCRKLTSAMIHTDAR